MRIIKVKDINGTVYKMPGRVASGVYDTETGREIFEGDILLITKFREAGTETYITDVIWEGGYLVIKGCKEDRYYDELLASWSSDPEKTFPKFKLEIIGNVIDNPELLEGKNERC